MKLKSWITKIQNKQLIEEFNSITVKESALRNYRNHVNGNKFESEELLTSKLKRNFMCGKIVDRYKNIECRLYGNLFIRKDIETNEIFYIYNNKTKFKGFNINRSIKRILNNYIGLENN